MAINVSTECETVLKLLARSHNVLISGAPGTGKSRLLAEVALSFESGYGISTSIAPPKLHLQGKVPIPPTAATGHQDVPAPTKTDRQVFRTVFHQNSKYRDFVSGVTPVVNKGAGAPSFTIVEGTLLRASKHANTSTGASLLIIDEINRGPAVQVFGGAIVSIEADKRLAPNGNKRPETQFFELLEPGSGNIIEYALPHDLYILAAMNQADVSVDALDVAFLRRWEPLRLEPNEQVLRAFYGLSASNSNALPDKPSATEDALEASVRAWSVINKKISLGRGAEFQIGHGVLMPSTPLHPLPLGEVLEYLCVGWAKIRAHVEEVFFGDTRGIAATLNALNGPSYNPFKFVETTFANDLRYKLDGPDNFTKSNIYVALRAFSEE